MAFKFAKGTAVKQVQPAPVTGVVGAFDLDQETGNVSVRVDWSDENGDHSRFFTEDELQAAE